MIQAPNIQYIPAQQPMQIAQQEQGANIIQYPQQPGVIYNYPTTSSYLPQNANGKSQFNGVNIEINNPQGQGLIPAQYYPAQQPIIAPYPAQQPIINQYPPVQTILPQGQQPIVQTEVPQPQVISAQPAMPAQPAQAPVVDQPVQQDSEQIAQSFAGRLNTSNVEEQRVAIEDIAKAVKGDDNIGNALLDTQIFDALVDIINKDTSNLEGASPEVIELRNKPKEELTAEELEKATTPSPLESAEINKQYALYTISYMQARLNNQLEANNGQALELKDLPCIENVINEAKSNPNPEVRVSALASLSHIARPEYKEDLAKIFELAKSDASERVQTAAENALSVLNGN